MISNTKGSGLNEICITSQIYNTYYINGGNIDDKINADASACRYASS